MKENIGKQSKEAARKITDAMRWNLIATRRPRKNSTHPQSAMRKSGPVI